MNRKRLFLSPIVLSAALIAPIAITANAAPQNQTTTTQTTTRDAKGPNSQTTTVQTTTQQVNAQSYTGKIDKKQDQYLLLDKDKKASYKLDDATKSEKFNGQDVKVVGTLDTSTNMIRVHSIEKLNK